ncbi:MAG: aldo/keto reductase [Candidatus Omnitrophota bacterium]
MDYIKLGLTELRISRIGFGCAPMGGYDYGPVDDQNSIRAVHKALDLGINFFDTSDIYGLGHAERMLAKALSKKRHEVVVATKFGLRRDAHGNILRDSSPANVIKSLEDSLDRLQLEAITLYQIHWPDPRTPPEETFSALLSCQKAGKIKHIGCSNFSLKGFQELNKLGRIESLQVPYNLLDRGIEKDMLRYCREAHVSILTHSSLARGFLSGKYADDSQFEGTDTRGSSKYFSKESLAERKDLLKIMGEISLRRGKAMSQIAVRWILDNPAVTCAIVGFKDENQVDDILGSLEWKLSVEEYNHLAEQTKTFMT